MKTQNNSNTSTFIVVFLGFIFVFSPLISGCGGDEDTSDNQRVGSIRGTIFPGATHAEVSLLSDGQQIATTQPNLHGNYVFSNVAPGTYEILAVATGYRPLSPEAVVVSPGQTVTQDFTLERLMAKLTGAIVAPGGLWVEHATVTAVSQKGQEIQETDPFGWFNFDGLWADVEITVTVEAEGLEIQTVIVEAIPGVTTVKLHIEMVALSENSDETPNEL